MTDRRLSEDHPRDPNATPWPEMLASFGFTAAEEQQVADEAERMHAQADDARLAEIRDQIRLACAKDAGFTRTRLADMEPHDYQVGADTIIAEIVQPLLARVDQLTTERDDARSVARSAAKLLRATADRIAVRTSESIDPNVLRRRARTVDEITGETDA